MSLIAVCSATGAPGVTTTALALGWVWPATRPGHRSLVVDADVAGSGILPGFLQAGVPAGGGVLALAGSRTFIDPGAVLEHVVALDESESRLVLTGITDPSQARVLGHVWSGLAHVATDLGSAGVDVIVDLGRLGHRHEPTDLLERADVVVVMLRGTLTSITGATSALRSLRELRGPGPRTTAVLIGEGQPYPAREITRELDLDHLHTLPDDPPAAAVLSGGGTTGWRFERSALLRGARGLAAQLIGPIDALAPTWAVRP
ncbi:MAG: hypothetical protein ACOH2F_10020 [Cellulomonas sp.]